MDTPIFSAASWSLLVMMRFVAVSPGWMSVTRNPVPTHSARKPFVKTLTKDFAALYTVKAGNTVFAASEEMFTMWPFFAANMCGRTAPHAFTVPLQLMSIGAVLPHMLGGRPRMHSQCLCN